MMMVPQMSYPPETAVFDGPDWVFRIRNNVVRNFPGNKVTRNDKGIAP